MNGVAKKRGDIAAKVIKPTHNPQVACNSGMLNTQAPRATINAQAPLPLLRDAMARNRKSLKTSAARNL